MINHEIRRSNSHLIPYILSFCLGLAQIVSAEQVVIVSNTTDAINGDTSNFDALKLSPGSDGISLREALLAAEGTSGPKRMIFAPALKGCSIRIGSEGFDVNYRRPILKSGQLTIDGDIDGDNIADVLLDGTLTPPFSPFGSMFEIWSSSNTITHLVISNFAGITINVCEDQPGMTNATIISNCFLSNVITPRDTNGAHAIMIAGAASWPDKKNRQILSTMISDNLIIKGDIGIGSMFNHTDLCISNTVITRNRFTNSDFAIMVSGGTGMEEDGSFIYGSNNVVSDTLIADNVIRGTTDSYDGGMGIMIVGGMIGASPNLVANTRIQNNVIEHSTMGVVLSGGDCNSDYIGWTNPVVYISNNVLTNTIIEGNTFTNCWDSIVCAGGDHHENRILSTSIRSNRYDGIVNCAVNILNGGDPQQGGPSTYGNLILDMDIQGNEIKSSGDGILICAARKFYSNPTSGASTHKISNVYVADNVISTAGVGLQIVGGMSYRDRTAGADSNVVENVTMVHNRIGATGDAGILLAASLSFDGPTRWNQLRHIAIIDNVVSGILNGVKVIGGISQNTTSVTSYNITEDISICSNNIAVARQGNGIEMLGGWTMTGQSFSNEIRNASITGNNVSASSIGLRIVGGDAVGANSNVVSVFYSNNQYTNNRTNVIVVSNEQAGAIGNVVNASSGVPNLVWTDPVDIIYGTALGNLQLSATADVPGRFVYSPPVGTVLTAGQGQRLAVTFIPSDTDNYGNATATATISVLPALPLISWIAPPDINYGTVLGISQLCATASVPGSFVYTPPAGTILTAGMGQVLQVSFMPTDTNNYTPASASISLNVLKATPEVTWTNPADITYGMVLDAVQLNGTSSVPGLFVYNPQAGTKLEAGPSQILQLTFTPTDTANYSSASKNVTLNVMKAMPPIVWTNPTDITYGTPVGAAQLNAASDVPGVFTYAPLGGAILKAGTNSLNTVFTPTDPTNYAAAAATVVLNVLRATPEISWTNPADIVYGTALGIKQLNANANVPGSFVYNPAVGMMLNAGNSLPLSATLTPTDTTNYQTATVAVSINVLKALLTVTAKNTSKTYGQMLTFKGTECMAGGLQNSEAIGSVTLTSSGIAPNAGVSGSPYSIVPSAATGGTFNPVNYMISYVNGALTVNPAALTVNADGKSRAYGTTNPELTATYIGFVNGENTDVLFGSPTLSTVAGTNSPVGNYSIEISPGTLTNANYGFNFTNGILSITPYALTVSADSTNRLYGAANPALTGTMSPAQNRDNITATFTTPASPKSAVGQYLIQPVLSDLDGRLGNYSVTTNDSVLTVEPTALTITANNRSKTFGQALTFSGAEFTTSGLQNSETIGAVTLASAGSATAAAVGSYSIVPSAASGGTFNPANYTLSYQNGTMTVSPAALTLAITNPRLVDGVFTVTLSTATGANYRLEYKNALANPDWTLGQTLPGTGGTITLRDDVAGSRTRFYRIGVQ